jgi:hypothetical protein
VGIFGFEIVDGPLDREGVIGDQMYSQTRRWRGGGEGRYLLLEVRMELFCTVGFARRGITAQNY